MKEKGGLIEEDVRSGVIDQLVADILEAYSKDPNIKVLPARLH